MVSHSISLTLQIDGVPLTCIPVKILLTRSPEICDWMIVLAE